MLKESAKRFCPRVRGRNVRLNVAQCSATDFNNMNHGTWPDNSVARYPAGSTLPKSTGKIRAVLKSVHKAVEPGEAGPLKNGLGKRDWVVVESFADCAALSLATFLKRLRRRDIPVRLSKGTRETQVAVQYRDLDRAAELAQRRDRPRGRREMEIPWQIQFRTMAVMTVGVALAVCFPTGVWLYGLLEACERGSQKLHAELCEVPFAVYYLCAAGVVSLSLGAALYFRR